MSPAFEGLKDRRVIVTAAASFLEQTSMRTFVTAEDVAHLVLFVCSDAGARISGQALAVDGHTESLSL